MFNRAVAWVAVCLALGVGAGQSEGALLNLTKLNPDIESSFITLTYNKDSQQLTALGWALTLTDAQGKVMDIQYGPENFSLLADITNQGVLVSGTVTITGAIPDLGITGINTLLLTGNLTDFGYPPEGGGVLEFRFGTTGGDLASYFPASPHNGISMNYMEVPPELFTTTFENYGDGVADTVTGAVPEPSALLGLMTGVSAAAMWKYVSQRIRRRVDR
jgi:hypothetical protein